MPAMMEDAIRRVARPLAGDADLDPLIDRIGAARVVMLGEASHGTAEYYTWRDRISRRLIEEQDFRFIAVEGDWPACYQVNRYIRGRGDARDAREALRTFERWPTWMWANEEVVTLVEWLRQYDRTHDELRGDDVHSVGFYGLDVYSLWDSMQAVIDYLERVDPGAVPDARRAYGCFDPYHDDEQQYALATTSLVPTSCEDDVVAMLSELRANAPQYREDGSEGYFNAEQNALVARNAELYYRAMVRGGAASWNVRDTHMMETLERLLDHHGPEARAIVWEHNTHIGDARATDMAAAGMVNIGQLARETFGMDDVVLVGFAGYEGSVIAGRGWGEPADSMSVPPARKDSWEDLLHRAVGQDALLLTHALDADAGADEPRDHRAIGVVYHPERERYGNYVPTMLPARYDALLYFEQTHALRPLEQGSGS